MQDTLVSDTRVSDTDHFAEIVATGLKFGAVPDDLTKPLPNQDALDFKFRDYRTVYALSIMLGLRNKLVYARTVKPAVIAERRRKNRVARKSRRINRLRSK